MAENNVTPMEIEEIAEETAAEVEVAEQPAAAETEAPAPCELKYVDEMGVIGPYTKLEGDIVTNGNITIAGHVRGNITAAGNVIISGVVTGKIICNNAFLLEDSSVEADIEAKGQVSIENDVEVVGPISGENVTIKGTVEGDIKAVNTLSLDVTAVVKGNITAGNFAVALGAKIAGNVVIG